MSRPSPEEVERFLGETYEMDFDYWMEEKGIEMLDHNVIAAERYYAELDVPDCAACKGEGAHQRGPVSVNCPECLGTGLLEQKIYLVKRTAHGVIATAILASGDGAPYALPPRNDLRDHSPDGFEFGYAGSGPAQLALALLADALQDDRRALSIYQDFKRETVAVWAGPIIRISAESIRTIVAELEAMRDPLPDPFAEPSDDPPEGAEVEHCGTVTLEDLDRLFDED